MNALENEKMIGNLGEVDKNILEYLRNLVENPLEEQQINTKVRDLLLVKPIHTRPKSRR